MHVKYRQDNLHRMTLYIDTYGSNGHELIIHVSFMIKYVCYTGFWIHWFCNYSVTIPNSLVTIGHTSLVGVGHPRSNSIMLLMLRTVCCAMAGALALYYRSLGIVPTLLRMDNILDKPYC